MKAAVTVMLKEGVLDPQGRAIEHALHTLGFSDVSDVRAGKIIVLALAAETAEQARAQADAMAKRLLANPVIERYEVEVLP